MFLVAIGWILLLVGANWADWFIGNIIGKRIGRTLEKP